MKKRLLSILLCLTMVSAIFPVWGVTALADTKSGIQIGTYTNDEYTSSVTLKSDYTFEFKMNFGEGFATVKGTWSTEVMDTGEIGVLLTVTSKHTGIVVYENYCFLSSPEENEVLYLTDGNAGIVPTETAFTFCGASTENSNSVTGDTIAAGKAAILEATKTNAPKLVSEMQAAASSGHIYSGYRGLVLDSWAAKEVGMADYLRLMPDEVNDYFHESITREDFAALVFSAVAKLTGMTDSQLLGAVTTKSFPDCTNQKVGLCAGLGIITGDTTGYFRPNDTITRQEAATMLSKLADAVGAKGTGSTLSFTDISGLWGEKYVNSVSTFQDAYTGNAVMGGTGNNAFSPLAVYSRQQAVMTIVRLVGAAIGTHGGGSTSTTDIFEAVSTAVGDKIEELGADGKLTDSEIVKLYDYTVTLKQEGSISSVKSYDDAIIYTTSDGIQGGIVIRRNSSSDGTATLGSSGTTSETSSSVDAQLLEASNSQLLSSTASTADKLYLGNNKVLFISAFSKDDSLFSTPMQDGIKEIKDKGYEVKEIYDATLSDFSKIGEGGYGMVFIYAHGIVTGNTFCMSSEREMSASDLQKEQALCSDGKAYIYQEVALEPDNKIDSIKCKFYISPAFFSYFLKNAPLDDAYVQMISCSSMKNTSMAEALLTGGVKAVTGYSDVVQVPYAAEALEVTASHLVEAKNPALPEINIGQLEDAVKQMAGTNEFEHKEYSDVTKTTNTRAVTTRFVATGDESLILGSEAQPADTADGYMETAAKAMNLLLAGDYSGYLAMVHPDATSTFTESIYWDKDKDLADMRSGKVHSYYSHEVVKVEIAPGALNADGSDRVFQASNIDTYQLYPFKYVRYVAKVTFQNDGEMDPDELLRYKCGCALGNLSGFGMQTHQITNSYSFAIDVETGKILNCI